MGARETNRCSEVSSQLLQFEELGVEILDADNDLLQPHFVDTGFLISKTIHY